MGSGEWDREKVVAPHGEGIRIDLSTWIHDSNK